MFLNRKQIFDELINNPNDFELLYKLALSYVDEKRFLRSYYLLKYCRDNNFEKAFKEYDYVKDRIKPNRENAGISLCMIVKNEEENLFNCLASVDNYVDEIIVVDTGSEDNTKKIARIFGANVCDFEWINDFSVARNKSLSMAKCKGILWLDADDVVPTGQEKIVDDIKLSIDKNCFWARVVSPMQNSETSEFTQIRFFPNRQSIYFEQKVHEQVAPSLVKEKINFVKSEFVITHTGYSNEDRKIKKAKRNIEIAELELKRNPDNVVLTIALGDSLHVTGDFKKSADVYKSVIDNPMAIKLDKDAYLQTFVSLALTEIKLGNEDGAINYLEKLLEIDTKKIDGLFLLGSLYMDRGDYKKGEWLLKKVLEIPDMASRTSIDLKKIKMDSLLRLVKFYSEEENWKNLFDVAKIGFEQFPNIVDFWLALGEALLKLGDYTNALPLFKKSMQYVTDGSAYWGVAVCLLVDKKYEEVQSVLSEGLNEFPNDMKIIEAFGDYYYDNKELSKALEYYTQVFSLYKKKKSMLWKMSSCALGVGDLNRGKEYIKSILETEPDNIQAKEFLAKLEKFS